MAESKITPVYLRLLDTARRSGRDQTHDLMRGARIAVRVRDNIVIVTFSRRVQPLGDGELKTFVKHCGVPAGAERIPAEGQKEIAEGSGTRYLVGYRWPETAALPLETP